MSEKDFAEWLRELERRIAHLEAVAEGADLSGVQSDISDLQAQTENLRQALGGVVYPHVETSDHRISISGGTSVSYAGGDYAVINGQRVQLPACSFTPAANKTYHLRFDLVHGWRLLDVSDSHYTHGAAEDDPALDSTYDDMLVAKVTVTSSGSAAVTPLANAARLMMTVNSQTSCVSLPSQDGKWHQYEEKGLKVMGNVVSTQRLLSYNSSRYFYSREEVILHWARRPEQVSFSHDMGYFSNRYGNRQFAEWLDKATRYVVQATSDWVLNNPGDCIDLTVFMSATA